MEQLTNLSALPPSGFKVAVFPLKIKGASAAPARVVAIFEGKENEPAISHDEAR
jgi:kynurenine formamidase